MRDTEFATNIILGGIAGFIIGMMAVYMFYMCKNRARVVIPETPVSEVASISAVIVKEAKAEEPVETVVEKASYYCQGFEGKSTANGESYDCQARTCAHKSLPFGTMVEITAENGNVTTCRVNDRGPFVEGRVFDLSQMVFEELAPTSQGVITIKSWRVL